ncbi:hypothetical protein SD70_22125 [Gordoniibacillus kamchatkensis]|uniref:histidine kinase n=1 Tax=Gordoniibacillus kamchatkensis TaxID=1590651 RepID=A0ABR5ADK0_9BACL|nr:ATP-binding protein [Paenibacillus sp. VKM B-2647]KIL39129.1 hypothetical protein SD70_22125 [Paenibacillus sp. VKM B-2647]
MLKIAVRDNGVGMEKERLQEVEAWLADDSGSGQSQRIGIKNVHDRIRLQYGDYYGLTLRSGPNRGTTVEISLPIKQLEGGEGYGIKNIARG